MHWKKLRHKILVIFISIILLVLLVANIVSSSKQNKYITSQDAITENFQHTEVITTWVISDIKIYLMYDEQTKSAFFVSIASEDGKYYISKYSVKFSIQAESSDEVKDLLYTVENPADSTIAIKIAIPFSNETNYYIKSGMVKYVNNIYLSYQILPLKP